MHKKMSHAAKYSLYGAIFGFSFPVLATLLDAWLTAGNISIHSLLQSQSQNPLIWMIDSAPIFLGLFACLGGTQYDQLIVSEQEKQALNEKLLAHNKELEDRVIERTVQLESSIKKLVALDQIRSEFIATVNHELRTPLTAIGGAIKLIQSNAVCHIDEKGMDLINLADRNINLLSGLVNDILDIEKIESGKLELDTNCYAVHTLVEISTEMGQPYADSFGINLQVDEFEFDIQICVDKRRFIQIMLNLLSNACKFSPSQSTVNIYIVKNGKNVRINVADNGKGISENLANKIFSKFVQGDSSSIRSQGGTGLGLNISKALTESMGGNIDFHPNKDGGTVFFLSFPIKKNQLAENVSDPT